jgi:hypothetical protein
MTLRVRMAIVLTLIASAAACGGSTPLSSSANGTDLVGFGQLMYTAQPPTLETWEVEGDAANGREACVSSVVGLLTLYDVERAKMATVTVHPRDSSAIQPHAAFKYAGCCFSTAQVSAAKAYVVSFEAQSGPCP